MAKSKSTRAAPRAHTFSEALTALELAAEDNAREGNHETAVAALRDAVSMFKAVQAPPTADAFDLRNDLDARLLEARATLDLVNMLVAYNDCGPSHLESLRDGTLGTATNSAMRRLDEAIELVDQLVRALRKDAPSAASAGGTHGRD